MSDPRHLRGNDVYFFPFVHMLHLNFLILDCDTWSSEGARSLIVGETLFKFLKISRIQQFKLSNLQLFGSSGQRSDV